MKTHHHQQMPSGGSDHRLVVLLRERGPMTLTQIGETLWGGKRNRQAYARPAGAMIARMKKRGIVRQALAMDLGGKRDVMDTAKWMLTDKHNTKLAD